MDQQTQLILKPVSKTPALGLREMVAVPFRHRKLVVISFLATVVGLTIGLLLLPPTYTAEMKILVKRDRTNIPLTSNAGQPVATSSTGMTDQEVNSEVDLLSSQELERKVAVALKLDELSSNWFKRTKTRLLHPSPEERLALATQTIDTNLRVEPPNRSNLVRVTYDDSDPEQAAKVLNTLGQFYLEKHLEVHKQAGSVEFFQKESERLGKELEDVKTRLAEFNRKGGIVSAELEKESTLQKLAGFEGSQQETNAAIASTEQRLKDLQAQADKVAPRMVTEVRNPTALLEQLNGTLYTLEMKRTELLQKYTPTYRPVRDLDEQIAATKKSIAEVEKKPLSEQTTNENPVYGWLTSEMAKGRSDLAALKARQAATARTVQTYRSQALSLDQAGLQQQTLLNALKTAEDNFHLALQKREEARMAEELDRQRIANVAIAEAAVAPGMPASSMLLRFAIALVLACIVSLAAAFTSDFLDPSFRTPAEAEALLNIPVLAVFPRTEEFATRTFDHGYVHPRSTTGTDNL